MNILTPEAADYYKVVMREPKLARLIFDSLPLNVQQEIDEYERECENRLEDYMNQLPADEPVCTGDENNER